MGCFIAAPAFVAVLALATMNSAHLIWVVPIWGVLGFVFAPIVRRKHPAKRPW